MDEVISKWGFGSGVSLFIAASVSMRIFIAAFSFEMMGTLPVGRVVGLLYSIAQGIPQWAFLLPIISTLAVFVLVVYAQAMRVDIPLSFGSIRGFGSKWPLRFIYASNIPVILTAALYTNIRLWAGMFSQRGITFLGEVGPDGNLIGGLAFFLSAPTSISIQVFSLILMVSIIISVIFGYYFFRERLIELVVLFGIIGAVGGAYISGTYYNLPSIIDVVRAVIYTLFFIGGSVLFSVFWINTAGMDAHSVAGKIQGSGMQIPGFRRDPRIIERVLNRYIPPLAILGGAFVGFLAAFANLTGALASGTGILLAVMIIYNLYEELAMQHMEDMHPALRKFIER